MATKKVDPNKNHLYYGDNLEVLRNDIASESVDLVYLDPPFNSNRAYSVLFKEKSGDDSQAQMEAFDDTWTWSQESEQLYSELMQSSNVPNRAKDALEAFRRLLGDNDVLAYLVMMTARLVELHRVLKPSGALYLHCDSTASHYLKLAMDSIFGTEGFRNEIIWKRRTGSNSSVHGGHRFGATTDTILFYGKSVDGTFNPQYSMTAEGYQEYIDKHFRHRTADGRRYRIDNLANPAVRPNLQYDYKGYPHPPNGWAISREKMEQWDAEGRLEFPKSKTGRIQRRRFLDEVKGKPVQNLWDDIDALGAHAAERLGYPTQKPVGLLERIISASSNPGDVVLDPFCGCGTTIDAAQKLGRRWIGIDITTLAIDLIDARLRHTYGESIRSTYEMLGIPKDIEGAHALFARSPFEFERWCVMQLDGQPNEKQVGDKGIDGVIRFVLDAKGSSGRALISVKGGTTGPDHVRSLSGALDHRGAEMGVFVCMDQPTRGMVDEANHSGIYTHPGDGRTYPRVQIITVPELLAGKRPQMPPVLLPYIQAQRRGGNEVMDTLI